MNKSRKIIVLLITIIFSMINMGVVKADTKNIEVDSINVKEKSGTITVVNPVLSSNEVTSNITFNKKDDFVTFELKIKNNENDKYKIKSIEDNNTNTNIKIEYNHDEDYISKGETTTVTIKLTYKNKLLNVEKINLNNLVVTINLVNEQGETTNVVVNNPITGDNILMYLLFLILALIGLIFISKKVRIKGVKIGAIVFLLSMLTLPFAIFALEKFEVKVKFTDIVVKGEFETYNISVDPGNGNPVEIRQIEYGQKLGDLPSNPTKNGYNFNKWTDAEGNEVTKDTIITGPIEIIANYNVITYHITYDYDGGSATNPGTYTVESQSITLTAPNKAGYTFSGWTGSNGDTLQTSVTITTGSTGNKNYKANYSVNDNTEYKVTHRYQNLDGTYTEEVVTEHGATDTEVGVPLKEKTGFVSPRVQNVTINGDGSTEVTYTYDREEYAFSITDRTYIDNSSTPDGTYKYETPITIKAIEREGYDFSWSDGETALERTFNITEPTSLTPVYTAKTNIPYKVVHQKQKITLDGYEIADTQNLTGTTDSSITPTVNTYEGFTSPETQTTTISGDGSTVVIYNYDRIMYDFSTNNNENVISTKVDGRYPYGTEITLTAKEVENKTFIKWSNDETANPLTITLEGNLTIEPIYQSDGYTVTYNANGGNFYDTTKLTNIVVYTEKQDQTDGKYETEGKYLNPTKTDNAFKGWYTDSECTTGNEFDIDTVTLTGDIEVYAKWQEGTAMFIDGPTFNNKLNKSTTSFSRSTTIPEEYLNDTYLVSTDDSEIPIYMWYDSDTKATKWYSNVTKAYTNSNSSYMFGSLLNIETLDLSGLNTSFATNMAHMFQMLYKLENLDLSGFDTNKVTDMSYMFEATSSTSHLKTLDISSFDTSSVTNMFAMFAGLRALEELNVTHFKTSKVTDFGGMFSKCSSLTELDVSNFSTISATNFGRVNSFGGMFQGCSGLTELNVTNFVTTNVTNMSNMFLGCSSLEEIDVSNFDTTKVTDMSAMFSRCGNLDELNISNFSTSNVTNMSGMFQNCSKIVELDLSNFDTSKVTDMSYMFYGCSSLEKITASNLFVTSTVTNSYVMFKNSTSLVGGKGTVYDANHIDKAYAHIDGGTSNPGYFTSNITKYTVIFNSNGGGEVSSITVNAGESIQSFITPTAPSGKVFDGWWTELNEGTKVNTPYTPEGDITLYAHWSDDPMPIVFSEPGECTFNGSSGVLTGDNCSYANGTNKYIDTGINLYNTENHDKDYEIGFTIVSYNPSEQVKQATFMNTKLEGNNYPGLVFRRRDNYDNLDFSSRKTSSTNERKFLDYTDGMKVKIYRITNEEIGIQEIFYSINDEEKIKINDLSQFNPEFDLSVWFGAAPTNASATAAQRILVNTTLKDMYIKLGTYQESSSTDKYKVTYNANGGSVSSTSKTINIGDQIGELPEPTPPTNKTFDGWYTELTGGIKVTSTYTPNNNITIYARYINDISGATISPSSISILNGGNETITVSNVEEEYTFSSNDTNIATVDSTGKITGTGVGTTTITITGSTSGKTRTINVTVEPSSYTVTLNANGGSVSPTSITHEKNVAIGELPSPTAPAGKRFDGWYTGLTDGIKVTNTYIPSGNITIYARYTDLKYTVTFDTNGGSEVPDQEVTYGGKVTRPATDPTKTGLVFDDWYTDNTYTTKFDFDNTTITIATTIYGNFTDPCNGFSTDSWSTIRDNLESDSSYYAVGCEKEVELDMDDDGTNESYTVRLANTSTPEVCSTEGYSQTACGTVIEFVDIVTSRQMNSSSTNEGGWKATEMVTYLNSDFYNRLPSSLQLVIIPTYPIVSSSGKNHSSTNITSGDFSINKLYLLSTRELGEDSSNDNKNDVTTDTRTLDYYLGTSSSENEIKRLKKELNGSENHWWLRTSPSNWDNSFKAIFYNDGTRYGQYGRSGNFVANGNTIGVAPAFRIGTMPEFTVTFDRDGGSEVPSQTVSYGSTATRPTTDPTKTGYTFDDWYTDDTYTTKFDFDTLITSDTTIYAKFIDPVAIFDTGSTVNIKMKKLSNQSSYESIYAENKKITNIQKSTNPVDISQMTDDNIVSASSSLVPIYMWFDNGTIYWWSEDNEPSLNEDSSSMFKYLNVLTNLDVSNFDTSNVTNMSGMFENCRNLSSLVLGNNFNTSKVTDMAWMFYYCYKLTTLDLSSFDTSKVTSMNSMFYHCENLLTLNLGSNFDTKNVTDMSRMFYYCELLNSLDVSEFETSKVTSMGQMFAGCSSLTELDVSEFKTSNVTNMGGMFEKCSNITTLSLGKYFDTSNVTNMNGMFANCNNLLDLDLGNIFDTTKVTNMQDMFKNCNGLTIINLGTKFNTENVTNMDEMFSKCNNLITIYVPTSFVITNVENSYRIFYNDVNLIGGQGTTYVSSGGIDYAHIDGGTSNPGYFTEINNN